MSEESYRDEPEPSYDAAEGNLISSTTPILPDPMRILSIGTKPNLIDLSATPFSEAALLPPSEREVESDGSPSKRAAAKSLNSWIGRLTTFDHPDEDEKHAINQVLATYGSVRAFLNELDDTKRTNKKLRFREQRFAHEPLLRRRRVDMLSPSLLRVLVVALQNELSASMELIRSCALEEHPLVVQQQNMNNNNSNNRTQPRDQQDLDLLLESGITGITSIKTSIADLSARQRDLIEGGLREQNRLLRQQVMRLQSCLTSLPWAEITTGIQNSPRIGTGFHESGYPSTMATNGSRSPTNTMMTTSMKQTRFENINDVNNNNNSSSNINPMETLKERLSMCAQQIEKLQHELMRTQSELQRTEATVNAQLDIEAKLIEEKAKTMRTNAQLGKFVMKVLHECKPKLAESIVKKEILDGWLEKHPGEDYDADKNQQEQELQAAEKASQNIFATKTNSKNSKNKKGKNNNNKMVDAETMTDLSNNSRNNRKTSPAESEEDMFSDDDDDDDNRTPRNNRRSISSSASQPGGNRNSSSRKSKRPNTAGNAKRSKMSPKNRRVLQSPGSAGTKKKVKTKNNKGGSSMMDLLKKVVIDTKKNGTTKDKNGDDLYKSRKLPGIVTPLDLSRAVGIDPFSVPSKLEDHRPNEYYTNKSKTLHPDHPTKDMQRPILYAENVPHSARILRIPPKSQYPNNGDTNSSSSITSRSNDNSTSPSKKSQSNTKKMYASPAEAAGGTLVIASEVVPFLTPVVVKYDRVLRQIFSHFAQTQARPVGSQGLFEEIAQWTTSLTHASFFKILSHFYVVPKLMNKKHAFALLIGTQRMIAFPMFIARLLDVAKLIAPRLFVLSDVASVEMLQSMYIECAEKEGLLGRGVPASQQIEEENGKPTIVNGDVLQSDSMDEVNTAVRDAENEKKKIRTYYRNNLNRIHPISAKVLVSYFMETNKWKILFRNEKTLRAIVPENGDGVWGWHDLRSYWWDKCSLSKEAVSSGNRADLMAAFNLPNILPVRHVSPKKRKQMKRKGSEGDPSMTPDREAIAFDLLIDFMVQTELPSVLNGSRRK